MGANSIPAPCIYLKIHLYSKTLDKIAERNRSSALEIPRIKSVEPTATPASPSSLVRSYKIPNKSQKFCVTELLTYTKQKK